MPDNLKKRGKPDRARVSSQPWERRRSRKKRGISKTIIVLVTAIAAIVCMGFIVWGWTI